MAKVRIEVFEGGVPAATISVPIWLVTTTSKLIPRMAGKKLQEQVDMDELMAMIKDPKANGTILEIVDHQANDRLVISIIGNEPKA